MCDKSLHAWRGLQHEVTLQRILGHFMRNSCMNSWILIMEDCEHKRGSVRVTGEYNSNVSCVPLGIASKKSNMHHEPMLRPPALTERGMRRDCMWDAGDLLGRVSAVTHFRHSVTTLAYSCNLLTHNGDPEYDLIFQLAAVEYGFEPVACIVSVSVPALHLCKHGQPSAHEIRPTEFRRC